MTETAAKRRIEASDIFQIKLVNDPQVSPDGQQVAFTVTNLDEKDNCYRSAIWLVATTGGEPRRLTSGKHRDSQPRWSPDGTIIAFTSDRDPDEQGAGQIWTIALGGGEPQRLTALAESVEEFAWSPDSTRIVAVSKVRHGEHNPDSDVRVIRTVRYRFDGEGFLDDKYRQLFVIDVPSGNANQLTDGPFEHRGPAWSPNGYEIAFHANRDDGWEFSHVQDIYVVRTNGREIRKVTDGTGAWSKPSWSPDGATIACLGSRRLNSDSARAEVFTVPAAGGSPASLTADFDRDCRDGSIADLTQYPGRAPLWDADGASLNVVFSDGGTVQLARIAVPDGELTTLSSGRRRVGAPSRIAGGGYVFVSDSPTAPAELYAADADGRNERKLTNFNDAWQASVALSEPEPFVVQSHDGTPIHGWIIKPAGFQPDTKYPLVLEIHGGPFGMYAEALFHEFQLLASRGFVVLYTNPRGSTGYGDEFAGQLYRAWGVADFPDLMAAVDWAIAQGYVDENRLGVTGGSYGGQMTNWVISHTTRFKAAVTGRCVSNLYSLYGTDDISFSHSRLSLGAEPWEDPDIYWKLSAISYVDQVETPLLIEHQEEDYRCSMEQAEQLFTALKRRGKTVELVRFPGESHGMSRGGKPKHRIERLEYIVRWFERYL